MTFDPQNQQAPGGFQPPTPGFPQQPPAQGFAPQPPAQGFAPQQGGQPMFQPSPRPNPFVGIPVSDYLRDGGALLLLLISLALPWFFDDYEVVRGAGRIEVVLLALLSVLTIAITYLARAGVFPSSVNVNTVMLLRTLANAPYILLVLVYLVIDMVSGDSPSGLGYSAAFGLAGALLAAQPRQSEVGTLAPGAPIGRTWYGIALGYGALAAVVALISLVFSLIATSEYFSDAPLAVISLLVSILFGAAAVVFPLVGILRRNDIWRTVAFGFGAVVVGVILVSAFDDTRGVETVHSGGYLVLFLAGLLGLASSPALRNAMTPIADLSRWFGAASLTLVVVMAVAGYLVLSNIFTLIQIAEFGSDGLGRYIGSIIVLLLTVGVAVFARISLRSNPAGSRWLVIGLLGGLVLLGIINVILLAVGGGNPGVVSIGLAFGLPLFAAYALTAPKSVREYFAANAPARPQAAGGYAGGYAGAPAAPGYPAAPAAPGYSAGPAAPAAGYPGAPAAPAAPGYAAPGYPAPPVAPAPPAAAYPAAPVPPVAPAPPVAGYPAAPAAPYGPPSGAPVGAQEPVAPSPFEAPTPGEAPAPAPSALAEAPAPSVAPAPEPSAPTEAPAPSVAPAPGEAPAPSFAPVPAEAPAPSTAPSEAPAPSVAPAEAPTPTEAPAPAETPVEAPTPSLPPTLPFEADPSAPADEPLSQFSEETTYARPQSSAPVDPTPPDAPVVLGTDTAPEPAPEAPAAPVSSPFAPPSGDPAPFAAPAAAAPIAPVPPMPEAPAPEPATEVLDPAVAEASDPASTAEKLFELARDRQDLWPLIAGNPSAYADLLTWFASSDNPEVQAALRARGL